MSHVVQPTQSVSKSKGKGKTTGRQGKGKNCWKVSIAESKISLIQDINSNNDLQPKYDERLSKLKEFQLPIQPAVYYTGSANKPDAVYVKLLNLLYSFNNIADAIDLCFKLFFVLDIKFNYECYNVWLFIQLFIYGITTEFDAKSPRIVDIEKMFPNFFEDLNS